MGRLASLRSRETIRLRLEKSQSRLWPMGHAKHLPNGESPPFGLLRQRKKWIELPLVEPGRRGYDPGYGRGF
jgi:hypothetical protein